MTNPVWNGLEIDTSLLREHGHSALVSYGGQDVERWVAYFQAGIDEAEAQVDLAEAAVQSVRAVGATSSASVEIGIGAKSLPLNAAATLPAGLYLACRASELANPVNYMIGTLAADLEASTAFAVTVPTGGAAGSGTYSDWVIVPAFARRAAMRSVSGADTQLAADHWGAIRYTGSGGHTQTLLSASTAGAGFETTYMHRGSGIWTVGTLSLAPGEAVTLISNGSAWEEKGAKGYGAPSHVDIQSFGR